MTTIKITDTTLDKRETLKDLAEWCWNNCDLGSNLENVPKFFGNKQTQTDLENILRGYMGL